MIKLSNPDNSSFIKQWLKGKPIRAIAAYFPVARQRVNQLIHRFLETETIPVNRRPGGALDEGTGNLVLQLHAVFDLDSVLPKKKIEDVVGTHILHTTIYRILLRNDLIEENMKENRQRKWVRVERDHALS